MKKIIVLAIALLSTGIVVATSFKKDTVKPVVKIEKTIPAQGDVANDAMASAD